MSRINKGDSVTYKGKRYIVDSRTKVALTLVNEDKTEYIGVYHTDKRLKYEVEKIRN